MMCLHHAVEGEVVEAGIAEGVGEEVVRAVVIVHEVDERREREVVVTCAGEVDRACEVAREAAANCMVVTVGPKIGHGADQIARMDYEMKTIVVVGASKVPQEEETFVGVQHQAEN